MTEQNTVEIRLQVPSEVHYAISQKVITAKRYGNRRATIQSEYIEAAKRAVGISK